MKTIYISIEAYVQDNIISLSPELQPGNDPGEAIEVKIAIDESDQIVGIMDPNPDYDYRNIMRQLVIKNKILTRGK